MLNASSDRSLAGQNELPATRSAPGCHPPRQERPPGRLWCTKPFPGMPLLHQKCALGPLGARTGRGRHANGGPWSANAPALDLPAWGSARLDRLPWNDPPGHAQPATTR
ncbi:hypothetical protein ES703_99324 [subsurface metagenome]